MGKSNDNGSQQVEVNSHNIDFLQQGQGSNPEQ